MAFKFYQRYVQQNDITDPRDWNLNMQDLVEEFNGRLDRDNIDESVVTTDMIQGNAFRVIRNDIDLSSSALIRAWWSGYWQWHMPYQPSSTYSGHAAYGTFRARITIDGIEIARIHKSHGWRRFDCGLCLGSLAVDAGPHVIQVEAKIFREPDGKMTGSNPDPSLPNMCSIMARDLTMWARRH